MYSHPAHWHNDSHLRPVPIEVPHVALHKCKVPRGVPWTTPGDGAQCLPEFRMARFGPRTRFVQVVENAFADFPEDLMVLDLVTLPVATTPGFNPHLPMVHSIGFTSHCCQWS